MSNGCAGCDVPYGPRVPLVDDTGNTRERQAIGNKADAASNAITASIIARLKYVEGQLSVLVTGPVRVVPELPEYATQDMKIWFAIGLFNTTGNVPIPVVDITPGTIDVIRYRLGVPTVIDNDVSLLKKDGLLYYEIDLTNVTWDDDDICVVELVTKSTVTISAVTYDIVFSNQACMVTDLGDIGTRIDTIVTDVAAILIHTTNLNKGHIYSTGFGTPMAIIDQSMTYQVELGDMLDDHLTSGEITTPGICTIVRLRPSVGSAVIVNAQALGTGSDGNVTYTYGWPNVSWQKGDVAWISFSGTTITKNGKTFDLQDWECFVPIGLPEMLQAWDTVVNDISNIYLDTQSLNAKLQFFDKWGTTVQAPLLTNVAASPGIGNITLPAMSGVTITRAEVLLEFRKLVDSSGAPNAIVGGAIQVQKNVVGVWTTAFTLVAGMWATDTNAKEGQGVKYVCPIDVSGEVDALNTQYNIRLSSISVTGASLALHDVRVGLRIWV